MAGLPDIVEVVSGQRFLGLSLSEPQETLLRAIYGLPFLSERQHALFHQCTGRATPYEPGHPFAEVTVIAGRRAGKDSRIAAPVVIFEALFGGHEAHLGRGETGVIALVAQDERTTRIAYGYVRAYLTESPLLRQMVAEELKGEIRLTNRITIACFACTAKSVRGWSIPCAVLDELAFFRAELGTTVDLSVQEAIRPAGIAFPQQRLVKITTPSLKAGVVWTDYTQAYGQDNPDLLVWQASTSLMNPAVQTTRLEQRARIDDPVTYAREYEAIFEDTTESAFPGAWIEAAVVAGRAGLAPMPGQHYIAAVDPSGGANDEFAVAVLHLDAGRFVVDLLRAWEGSRHAKVDLAAICEEIAGFVRLYGIGAIVGDHYAGRWVEQEFRRSRVSFAPWEGTKSQAYQEALAMFAQQRVELVDDAVMIRQFRLLQRRPRIGGKPPVIDHPVGGHDDRANAVAVGIAHLAKWLSPAADIGSVGDRLRGPAEPTPADPESRRLWRELEGGRARRAAFWGERGTGRLWRGVG